MEQREAPWEGYGQHWADDLCWTHRAGTGWEEAVSEECPIEADVSAEVNDMYRSGLCALLLTPGRMESHLRRAERQTCPPPLAWSGKDSHLALWQHLMHPCCLGTSQSQEATLGS